MPLVVDASLAYRIIIAEDDEPLLDRQVQEWRRNSNQLVAPSLWLYEMTSAVAKLIYFGQMEREEARRALRLVYTFPIELIIPGPQLIEAAFDWSLRLQRANAYDSFYLALAAALDCELWTADQRLVNAAKQSWVKCPIN